MYTQANIHGEVAKIHGPPVISQYAILWINQSRLLILIFSGHLVFKIMSNKAFSLSGYFALIFVLNYVIVALSSPFSLLKLLNSTKKYFKDSDKSKSNNLTIQTDVRKQMDKFYAGCLKNGK